MKLSERKHQNISTSLLNMDTRNNSMIRYVYLIMFVVSFVMTVVNYFTDQRVLMVYTLVFCALCSVNFLMSYMGTRWQRASKVLFQIELCFLCLYFVVSGNPDGFSVIWVLFVPGCAFLLFEWENASILSIVILLMLVFFFYTPAGRFSLLYKYSSTFMLRFPMLYMAFLAVAMFLSYSVKIYQDELQRLNEGLEVEVKQRSQDLVKKEMELEKLKTEAMISQIRPHFIYNTISAIAAIPGNSDKTVNALVDFGKYLRANIDVFSNDSAIPIDEEIEHVKRYVRLEKIRFENSIDVTIEMFDHDFSVPQFSVQMLVENAIKHGLQPQRGKGNVWIISERIGNNHIVTVKDNGVGFDINNVESNQRTGIGLANVKKRVKTISGGWLEIESKKCKGTEIKIIIPECE